MRLKQEDFWGKGLVPLSSSKTNHKQRNKEPSPPSVFLNISIVKNISFPWESFKRGRGHMHHSDLGFVFPLSLMISCPLPSSPLHWLLPSCQEIPWTPRYQQNTLYCPHFLKIFSSPAISMVLPKLQCAFASPGTFLLQLNLVGGNIG